MQWSEIMKCIGDEVGMCWMDVEKKLDLLFERMAKFTDSDKGTAKRLFYDMAHISLDLTIDLAKKYLIMESEVEKIERIVNNAHKRAFVGNKTGVC